MGLLGPNAEYYVSKGSLQCYDDSESLHYFDKAIKKNPKYADAYFHKGRTLTKLKRYQEAIDCLSKGFKIIERDNFLFSMFVDELRKANDNMEKIKISCELPEIKNKLIYRDLFHYIIGFINLYGYLYHEIEVQNLLDLLKKKGFKLSKNELILLIDYEEYEIFKERMLYNNPITLKEYVKNYCSILKEIENEDLWGNRPFRGGTNSDIVQNDPIEYLIRDYPFKDREILEDFLLRLLKENKIIDGKQLLDQYLINDIINDAKKKRKVSQFEKQILNANRANNNPILTLDDINKFDGFQFEYFLKILLEKMGYFVDLTPLSGDQGADLIVEKNHERYVVQAKRYHQKVGNKSVQEIVASIAHYNASKGMVITNSQFTKSAMELASSNNIKLINGHELKNYISKYPVRKKEIDNFKHIEF